MKNFLAGFFCGSCFILGAADLAGLNGLWTEPDDGERTLEFRNQLESDRSEITWELTVK